MDARGARTIVFPLPLQRCARVGSIRSDGSSRAVAFAEKRNTSIRLRASTAPFSPCRAGSAQTPCWRVPCSVTSMDETTRPGLDHDGDARTRLMTRRLSRSDASPVLVVPVSSPWGEQPATARVSVITWEVEEAEGPALAVDATVAKGSTRASRGRVLIATLALVAVGVASVSTVADHCTRAPVHAAAKPNRRTAGAPPVVAEQAFAIAAIPTEVAAASDLAVAAPPTTGVPRAWSAPREPARFGSATPSLSPAKRAPRSLSRSEDSAAASATSARTPALSSDLEIAEAQRTARLASDEVAASLSLR
jgi:hypothetical protein